jgi:hypothetical protein
VDRVGADPEAVTLHMQATRPRRLAAHARRRVTGRAALITVAFGLSLLAPAPALGAFGFVSTWGTNVDVGGGSGFEVCTATCQAGTAGSGPGGLDLPWGLAVSAAGDVYVPDLNNNRISQYTAAGTFIRAWGKDVDPGGGTGFEVCTTSCKAGTAGGGPGELNQAIGAAVDSAGNVYVTDYMNNRIDEFTATGSFVRAWGKDVDPGGGTGFEICTIACKQGAAGGAAGELNQPIGVAVGRAGDIYVGDTTNQRIQEFTSAGSFVRAWGKDVDPGGGTGFEICSTACKAGAPGGAAGEMTNPTAVAVSLTGDVHVADGSNLRVDQFTSTGTFVRAWGKDVDPGGATVFEICTTSCKTGANGFGPGEFNTPQAIAVDGAGNVYVAENSSDRVQQFTSTGLFTRTWGEDVDSTGGTGFEVCTATCQFGQSSGLAGSFNTPLGVATDCRGDIYVSDTNNHRVEKFGDPATPLPPCIATGPGGATGGGGPRPLAALSRLRVSPTAFRAAARGPAATSAARAPVGARVTYRLTQASSVRFKIQRRTVGRKVRRGGKGVCVRQTKGNRRRARCTRFVTRGSFTRNGAAGSNSFRLTGRVKGHKLALGRYRLVATPTAGGRSGRSATVSFRIVGG